MSDPAIEAAKGLHKPVRIEAQDATGRPAIVCATCRNVHGWRADWPTATDRLLYSSDELGDNP